MTIKISESFSATGAEFSIDLEKLKKLIDKNAITVLAKVQEDFLILWSILKFFECALLVHLWTEN